MRKACWGRPGEPPQGPIWPQRQREKVHRAEGEGLFHDRLITVGMIAFLLLPLAATSTNAMVRRLGGRRWQRLHRLVYPAAVAVHFYMMVKADVREPLIYGAIAAGLLGYRAVSTLMRRKRRDPASARAA